MLFHFNHPSHRWKVSSFRMLQRRCLCHFPGLTCFISLLYTSPCSWSAVLRTCFLFFSWLNSTIGFLKFPCTDHPTSLYPRDRGQMRWSSSIPRFRMLLHIQSLLRYRSWKEESGLCCSIPLRTTSPTRELAFQSFLSFCNTTCPATERRWQIVKGTP